MLKAVRRQIVLELTAMKDPVFFMLMSLGLLAWLIPSPQMRLAWPWLLAKAFVEEFFFRFFLQDSLDRWLKQRRAFGPLSWANLLTSLVFAGMHFFRQPLPWALITFFPSLAFGYAWDRYRNLLPCGLIHFFYNLCLFYRVVY